MALVCSISNEVPEVPVLSPVSGALFEKRLIIKYIQDNHCDPTNGKDLDENQLIEVKTGQLVKPKAPTATSVPATLKSLQDEWDAVMLNAFTLRQQLQTARQELSQVLYQHDAACRTIGRLTQELNAAREALATLKPKASIAVSGDSSKNESNEEDEIGLTNEILEKLDSKAAILTAERKKKGKTIPEGLATAESIKGYKTIASHSGLHSTSTPGILCMDISVSDPKKVCTGGNDKIVTVFDKESEQIVCQLKGHSKKVTSVIYHPNGENIISASPDSQIRVWSIPSASTAHLIRAHEGPVTAISLHATGDYLLSTSHDEEWVFSDVTSGKVIVRAKDTSDTPHSLTTAQFHPDGLIFATGTSDSLIKIWDLKEKTSVATFPGHTGQISAISFSENGFYLATANDSVVKLWDLRKLKNVKNIVLDEGYQVKHLTFDQSGYYLAIAGTDVRVYVTKQWDLMKSFSDHTALATGVCFGDNANFILSSALDRTLKVYASS